MLDADSLDDKGEDCPNHRRVNAPILRGRVKWARGAPPTASRGGTTQTVNGTGPDEAAALRDLDDQLRGVDRSHGTRLDELRQRLRLAYVEGGRGLEAEH